MPEFNKTGSCPICQEALIDTGASVVCSQGHYRASFRKWDNVWNSFNPTGDSKKLMDDLLALNEVKISKKEVEKLQKEISKK